MSSCLLDVNVLIALIDSAHVHHGAAHAWFARRDEPWMSCPTTQNGVLRIVSDARYRNPRPLVVVADSLQSLLDLDDHVFVPDSLSLLDAERFERELLVSKHVTDGYLLGLAVANGASLATFDRRLKVSAVVGAESSVEQLG